MNPGATRRLFVSGDLVEFWEDPSIPFGWTRDYLQYYANRRAWVLLFNAVALTALREGTEQTS